MSDQMKRFVECLIPVTACNIKCSYCYVIQRDNREMKLPKMKYSIDTIGKGLNKDRWGGTCYFSICGAGETLLPHETVEIVNEILKQGHYANITTNGTLSKRFDEIVGFPADYLERLNFSFSFHYLELKRINKLQEFFENIKKIRKAGCSFVLQINLCDEYLPYIDEIKKLCINEVGAMPQVAATRREENLNDNVQLLTDLTFEEYCNIGDNFDSPLFKFTMKNFNVHRQEFCYAGDWTQVLDLSTGIMSRCYGSQLQQDIFKNINEPIKFQAIGKHCKSLFCMNSSHFLSLGAIPSMETPTYASLRNREEATWYSLRMREFLDQKLKDNNELYDRIKMKKTEKCAKTEKYKDTLVKYKVAIKRIIKRTIVKVK